VDTLAGDAIRNLVHLDGSYWLYWHFKGPIALEMMRDANFFASLSLYGMCGVVWLYRGSLRQLFSEIGARCTRRSGEREQLRK